MPLTDFQAQTLRLLAAGRSPESFLAGGTVLNAGVDSPRYRLVMPILIERMGG